MAGAGKERKLLDIDTRVIPYRIRMRSYTAGLEGYAFTGCLRLEI